MAISWPRSERSGAFKSKALDHASVFEVASKVTKGLDSRKLHEGGLGSGGW